MTVRRVLSAALVASVLALAGPLAAQSDTARPSAARRVAGRIVRSGAGIMRPVAGVWVTLHRVATDSAGPIDSVRSSGSGGYAFAYRARADSAVYFVSATYGGITYFTPSLHAARVVGDAAEITVFDTTSVPFPLGVRGRHMVVSSAGEAGARTVIEVFEISNDSAFTLVSPSGAAERPTWATGVPGAATEFRMGQGDVTSDAVKLQRGRVEVYAPFAPGLKQLSFSYVLSPSAFPLSVPIETAVDVLEVLVQEAEGDAQGAGLTEVSPVNVEGRLFQRFLAQDVTANGVFVVTVPPPPRTVRPQYLLLLIALIGAAMLVSLARAFARRGDGTRAGRSRAAAHARAEQLAREIADLDAAFERQRAPGDEARARYADRRAALKRALGDVLAEGDGGA